MAVRERLWVPSIKGMIGVIGNLIDRKGVTRCYLALKFTEE
jgi:hypothetical protein